MTKDQKIEAIRQKCIEANPGKQWQTLNQDIESSDEYDDAPIRLADVLLAVIKSDLVAYGRGWSSDDGDDFFLIQEKEHWNLRQDDLTKQSEETVEFIHQLLCS